jgi:hypothetical protein
MCVCWYAVVYGVNLATANVPTIVKPFPNQEIPMVARHWSYRMVHFSALAMVLAVAPWLAAAAPTAKPDKLEKLDISLKLVPGDVAFYSSLLPNREQASAIRHSRAWAKIREMPLVQLGLSLYAAQVSVSDSVPAKIDAALHNPEVRKILDLATDMVSDEAFVVGDKDCIDFAGLLQNANVAMSYGPMLLQATGQAEGHTPNQLQATMVMSALAQHADQIKFPGLLLGFKLKNTQLANEELLKLETIGNLVLENMEQTKGHFKKTTIDKHEYLTFTFDGDMIPWDEVPLDKLKEMELKEGDADKVIKQLKKTKLVIGLGLRDKYLLVSIGSSLKCLEKFGKGAGKAPRLSDRPELKPLAKFADRRLTGIGYLSADMSQQLGSQRKTIGSVRELLDKVLPQAKLSDEQKARIRKDVEGLTGDLKVLLPKLGARVGLSFFADRGIESYQYAWGEYGRLDSSKPLGLLQHVGGNPILGMAARAKITVTDYDLLVKWGKTAYGYFKDFGLPSLPDADREKAKKFLDAAIPLFHRLDKANRDSLLPALADGQVAFVLDGKLQSKHIAESLPTTEKPLPMLEPAIVVSLSNAKLLKKGLGEYRSAINDLIDAVRHLEGSHVPEEIRIPEPQVAESSLGTIYSFSLPEEWGVDKQLVPNLAISDKLAVISASRKHSERLLKATPLTACGLLGKVADRKLAIVGWLDWAALVKTATPWVDFAIEQGAGAKGVNEDQQKMVVSQAHVALNVLAALRSITWESYLENGVLVSHSLCEIHDVAK